MWIHHGFPPFFFFFFIIIIGFIIFRISACGRYNNWNGRHMNQGLEPVQILKQRLVKGEITEEDYNRLKEVISK